jgi:hypothetical protein
MPQRSRPYCSLLERSTTIAPHFAREAPSARTTKRGSLQTSRRSDRRCHSFDARPKQSLRNASISQRLMLGQRARQRQQQRVARMRGCSGSANAQGERQCFDEPPFTQLAALLSSRFCRARRRCLAQSSGLERRPCRRRARVAVGIDRAQLRAPTHGTAIQIRSVDIGRRSGASE